MTKATLIARYNEELANQIIDAKLSDPQLRESQVKEHPDFPGNPAP